jgi:hypothetical protein
MMILLYQGICSYLKAQDGMVWQYTPVIPALGTLRQEEFKFQAG